MAKMATRLQEFILRIMIMDVHIAVFLTVGLSVCHSAVTLLNTMGANPDSGLIFLGHEAVNYVFGSIGIVVGILLIVTLARKSWSYSFGLALANVSVWAFTMTMLIMNSIPGGAVMSAFYVLVHTYIALSTWVHNDLGLNSNTELRRHLEGEK